MSNITVKIGETTLDTKKVLGLLMTLIIAVSSIISGVMVYTGRWTPEQSGDFESMIQRLVQDMNLTYQQVIDALQIEVGSTLFGLAGDYSYLITHPLGET